MTDNSKVHRDTVDEALIANYDNEEDTIPIKAKTARSVSFARNYLICNVVIQCLLFAFIIFFVLTEEWYILNVIVSYKM